jgi:hypothetical protein
MIEQAKAVAQRLRNAEVVLFSKDADTIDALVAEAEQYKSDWKACTAMNRELLAEVERMKQEKAEPPTGPAYGIIDPDYARVYTQARIIAWQYGYACVMHGSFTRDLDLLLVPWENHASGNGDQLLKLIAQACGLRFKDGEENILKSTVDWSDKPHRRKACSLYFPAFGDRRWVDISIVPTGAKA